MAIKTYSNFKRFLNTHFWIFISLVFIFVIGFFHFNNFINNNIRLFFEEIIMEIEKSEHSTQELYIKNYFLEYFATVTNLGIILPLIEEDNFENIAIEAMQANENIDNIFIGFVDGSIVNSLNFVPPDEQWSSIDREWFTLAVNAGYGNIAVSNPYISYATGVPTIAISTYIPNRFVVGAAISIETVINYILQNGGEHSHSLLLSRDGHIIASTALQYNLTENGEIFNIENIPGGYQIYNRFNRSEYNPSNEINYIYNIFGLEHAYLFYSYLEMTDWYWINLTNTQVIINRINTYINPITTFFTSGIIILFFLFFIINQILILKSESSKTGDEKIKAIINAFPSAINITNPKDWTIEYANDSCISLFEFETFENYRDNFSKVIPKKQPNGKNSIRLGNKYIQEAMKEGSKEFEWLHLTSNNKPIHCNISLIRIKYDKKYKLLSYIKDLRIQEAAFTDELTGIYSRKYLMKQLEEQMPKIRKEKGIASFIIFDIDHFKKINDTYLHAAGDEVLKVLVTNLKTIFKKEYIFSRYGGEEFVVFLPNVDENEAKKLALKMRLEVANIPIPINENILNITCSFGVYTCDYNLIENKNIKDEGKNFGYKQCIGYADRALYEAKKTGRNKVVIYHDPNK